MSSSNCLTKKTSHRCLGTSWRSIKMSCLDFCKFGKNMSSTKSTLLIEWSLDLSIFISKISPRLFSNGKRRATKSKWSSWPTWPRTSKMNNKIFKIPSKVRRRDKRLRLLDQATDKVISSQESGTWSTASWWDKDSSNGSEVLNIFLTSLKEQLVVTNWWRRGGSEITLWDTSLKWKNWDVLNTSINEFPGSAIQDLPPQPTTSSSHGDSTWNRTRLPRNSLLELPILWISSLSMMVSASGSKCAVKRQKLYLDNIEELNKRKDDHEE